MSDAEQPQPLSRNELQAKIVAKAWTDQDFCRKFLADPKGQFEEHLGIKLPESLIISAHQEDANSLHFVIPAKPPVDLDELSDEDLEKVAGGIGIATTIGFSALAVSLIAATAASAVVTSVGTAFLSAAAGGWGIKK